MSAVGGCALALLSAATAGFAAASPPVQADVAVYSATGGGFAAAVAASRAGAKRVVLIEPSPHVGAMNTGGLQHADPGNESTVGGIAHEFFTRVVGSSPAPPPSPGPGGPQTYTCLANRCIPLDFGANGTTNATCGGACAAVGDGEWLAVTRLSALSDGNMTLTVTLPAGQRTSCMKKSEKLCKFLPPADVHNITQGEVLHLARPAQRVDDTYLLVELEQSPLGRLVRDTGAARWRRRSAAAETEGSSAVAGSAGDPPPGLHPGAPPGWLYPAHVAERVMNEMLAEANVTVLLRTGTVASASVSRGSLASVTTTGGVTVAASAWVDGSYEGDLAFAAGATMTWGRESKAQYGEPGAGVQPPTIHYPIDPFWPNGEVIPHVSDLPVGAVGSADKRIEVYDFRLCMTDSPSHRVPVTEPPGYNASDWEFWRRLYNNGTKPPSSLGAAGLGCLGPIPNNYSDCAGRACVKCDMLGMKHATDMLNGAWGYPNATAEERRRIRQSHINYTLGLLWFWASDPASGDALHAEMATVGYCSDEFGPPQTEPTDPPHWPYQLYVREARRLVGDWVWTEMDPPMSLQERTVGLGAYSFDCHWVSLFVDRSTSTPAIAAEGRVNQGRNGTAKSGVLQMPFPVPYDALLPKRAELANVVVPVACSASHVRFNAIRMEPVWMVMGQAAGAAAALAVSAGAAVQDVGVPALQKVLLAQGAKLTP